MSLIDVVRKLTPSFLLEWNRTRKKNQRNSQHESDLKAGVTFGENEIQQDLISIGIETGDTLLVHSSLSKIGYLQKGPETLINALITTIGESGHLLMPTSPNNVYQLNYIQNTPFFDVLNSPSKTGAITEFFRTMSGVERSLHPTEPVSAFGKNANDFVKDHFNELTPYTERSPFYKVAKAKGKILYIGVTLDNAGTSLHVLEDAIKNFKFPIYYPHVFEFDVIDEKNDKHKVKTKVHHPEWSKKRKCDELIPMFETEGVLKKVKIGNADTLLLDAEKMLEVMINKYHEKGVTMYTPKGS
jgi:aminoglycoside 3-N-acetyltransferase